MKFSRSLVSKVFLILFTYQIFLNIPRAHSAEKIKIIYSIFSRTVTVDSLKNFAETGNSSKSLTYKDNLLHGTQSYFYDNGQPKKIINYKEGRFNGSYTTFYPDSIVKNITPKTKGVISVNLYGCMPNYRKIKEIRLIMFVSEPIALCCRKRLENHELSAAPRRTIDNI